MTLDDVISLGFDRSWRDEAGYVRVRCSACNALVVNRTPCHESGCPNMQRDTDEEEEFDGDAFQD